MKLSDLNSAGPSVGLRKGNTYKHPIRFESWEAAVRDCQERNGEVIAQVGDELAKVFRNGRREEIT